MATRSDQKENQEQENSQQENPEQKTNDQKESYSQHESFWERAKEHTTIENLIETGAIILDVFLFPDTEKAYRDCDKLLDLLAKDPNRETVLSHINSCEANDLLDECRTILSKSSECITKADKEMLVEKIENAQTDIFAKFIFKELLTCGAIIWAQTKTLRSVWKELSEASNVIIQSADLRKTIKHDLDELELKSENLKKDMQKFAEQEAIQIGDWNKVGKGYKPEVTREGFAKFEKNRQLQDKQIRDFHSEIMELDRLCMAIRSKMDLNIKIKINNEITQLKFANVNCVKDGVIDGTYFLKGAYDIYKFWSQKINKVQVIKLVTTFAFGALLVANTYTALVTADRIKELQSEWAKLEELGVELDKVQSNIKLVDEWRKQMDNHMRSCWNKIK